MTAYQTGKILIHPTDPDVVYVGALGRLYGPNPERGLFKTEDGGRTWVKALYIDDNTGVIDARMDPTNPDVIYVAMWERRRDEYDSWPGGGLPDGYDTYDPLKKWGTGAGIYKSTDDGDTWNPCNTGLPDQGEGAIFAQSVGRGSGTFLYAGTEQGIYRSDNEGASWTNINGSLTASSSVYANKWFYFNGTLFAVFTGSIQQGGGIARSTNNGNTWLVGHSGMGSNMTVYHIAQDNGTLIAATNTGWRSAWATSCSA